jgi:hypothetical protein
MGWGIHFCVCLLVCAGTACAQSSSPDPRQIYEGLNAVRVDSAHVYPVRDISIRRDAVRLWFTDGRFAFLTAYNGRVTGAVFSGHGRALALPRDPIEKAQLARFLGTPLLDQGFTAAYIRFTDDTADEISKLLRDAGVQPVADGSLAEQWNSTVANLNPEQSLRILTDWLATEPQPYFYAAIIGEMLGAFDILVDDRRREEVLLGQTHWESGRQFFDVWASFPKSGEARPYTAPFVPVSYVIDTSIQQDLSLQGTTVLALRAARGGERVIPLELSRSMEVRSVEDSQGHALVFFRNETLTQNEAALRGNDVLLVVLPAPLAAEAETQLRVTYHGTRMISDAGNGVYFVGDRGSWYPHIGGTGFCAPFDLTFRWPQRLKLVATGKQLDQKEEGDHHLGHWRSEVPIPVAGFNLGDYVMGTADAGTVKVDVYANRQVEQAIAERIRRTAITSPLPALPGPGQRSNVQSTTVFVPDLPPSPAATLKDLSGALADAVRFYERLNGPLPYERVAVSQISGTFGQGWPGLVYLSTLSFLTPTAQRRVGVSARVQEHFTEIVPYHEVAHQWWGNLVVWENYRDQWIQEGMANYQALLYAESRKPQEHPLAEWLERYRKDLLSKEPGRDSTVDEAGPIVLGYRLRSSKNPAGYDRVVYEKGAWVFHMLRMMLRDPAAKNPDDRFSRMLRSLLESHRFRAVTTDDLQHAVEAVMTPSMALEGDRSMDWFFDQWVRGTGIPQYAVEFSVKPQGTGFVVRGTLKQNGVPDSFLAPVPLYAARAGGKPVLLGTVIASGRETSFRFVTQVAPKKILIDPQMTLLCLPQ